MTARKLFCLGESRGSVGAPQDPSSGGTCEWRGPAGALPVPRVSGVASSPSPQAKLSALPPLAIFR
jgi:hypothetical protein